MKETRTSPPKSRRDNGAANGLHGEASIPRTPEEELKVSRFYQWMEGTAQEQNLNATQKVCRKNLYEQVNALRPYTPLERRREVEALVEAWATDNPTDPLAKTLVAYVQSALEEALLWQEAFPDREPKGLPALAKSRT